MSNLVKAEVGDWVLVGLVFLIVIGAIALYGGK